MLKQPPSLLRVKLGDIVETSMSHDIEVEIESHGIVIRPVGYGDKLSLDGSGSPVLIEFQNGIPVVIVWDDINTENPSHKISLRNAVESARHEE